LPVPDPEILELTRSPREAGFKETAERLEVAYDLETKIVALTIAEREQIIRAVGKCHPEGCAKYRFVTPGQEYARLFRRRKPWNQGRRL